MKLNVLFYLPVFFCLFQTTMFGVAYGQAPAPFVGDIFLPPGPGYSVRSDAGSSFSGTALSDLPEAPERVIARPRDRSGVKIQYQSHVRAFTYVAAAVTVGVAGVGIDVATPLSTRWNMRVGGSVLTGNWNFNISGVGVLSDGLQPLTNGIAIEAEPRFSTVFASLDWFPRYGNFRVSPGLTLYNGNHGTALASVQGGQVLSVGDGNYTSDPTHPILATIHARFGRPVAPRLTVGWGNMLPREGSHFSFPFEIGVQYVGTPTLTLALSGNSCDSGGNCGPIAGDPTTIANVVKEQSDLNDSISPLRFYPILSTGVSYRF